MLFYIWLLTAGFSVLAAEFHPAVLKHEASAGLLDEKTIQLHTFGTADISFQEACDVLCRDDLLVAVQQGYAQTLPDDEEPEFVVTQLAAGQYRYVNRHGQETRIEEVSRALVSGEKVTIILYSEGRRFFGEYRSLCQVEVVPSGKGRVDYAVIVYAHPESTAVRLFVRLAPMELFFRHKMRELTDLVVDVCDRILTHEPKGKDYVVYSF